MRILSYTLAAALSIGSLAAQNRSIEFEHGSWADTKAKAKAANKLIFVDAYATWCGPCKWMAKNIFTQDAVADYYNANFINAKLDVEAGDGIAFAQEYGVTAMPTFFFIDGDGKRVHVALGGMQQEEFIQMAKDALNPNNRVEVLEKKYAAGDRSAEVMIPYLKKLADLGETAKATTVRNAYFASLKPEEFLKEQNWKLFTEGENDWNTVAFSTFRSRYSEFANAFGEETVQEKLQKGIVSEMEALHQQNALTEKYPALRKQVADISTFADREKMLLQMDIMLYESQGKELEMYQTVAKYVDKYMVDSPSELNEIAWKFCENVKDTELLKRAQGWAKKSFEQEEQHYTADTYANIAFALGNKKEAIEWENKAIQLAKKQGADASTYEENMKNFK